MENMRDFSVKSCLIVQDKEEWRKSELARLTYTCKAVMNGFQIF